MISIVLVTCNRLHLLQQCVENVLWRTSDLTQQIIVWNNNSTDGTKDYLDALDDPRLRIIHHEKNIGTNAFARGFALTIQDYLIELDDDVIDAPEQWDKTLLHAFQRLPRMAFLAANVVDDGKSVASRILYCRDRQLYRFEQRNGVNLMVGPTGGWCTMTSRKIYDEVGGFREHPIFTFLA